MKVSLCFFSPALFVEEKKKYKNKKEEKKKQDTSIKKVLA